MVISYKYHLKQRINTFFRGITIFSYFYVFGMNEKYETQKITC